MVETGKMTSLFIFGILLALLGGIVTVISLNMLPTVLQTANDVTNFDVSGVSLTTSQTNLINTNMNIITLLFIYIGVIVMILGFVIMILVALPSAKGK